MTTDIHQIPIIDIHTPNPRSRNKIVFQEIINNIQVLGLKRPITVTRKPPDVEGPPYHLVCGQGRLEAFKALGATTIPAIVIEANQEEGFLMSLVENIARRQPSNVELLSEISNLKSRGYSTEEIARKLNYDESYVQGIAHLLAAGEERLIEYTASGRLPISVAVRIASGTNQEVQQALCEAYDSGALRGYRLRVVRKLITSRLTKVPAGNRTSRRISADSLVRAYQRHTEKQQALLRRAERTKDRMLLLVTALKRLFADEHLLTLLRAEGLDTMPESLFDDIHR